MNVFRNSFSFFLLFFTICLSAQQGLKLGIQAGLPLNEFNEEVGIVIGADLGYMWALGEVIDLGLAVGYIHGFPEKFDRDNPLTDFPSTQFIPLAGSLRIWPSNSFSFGVDVGQALGINEGNEGGLYYRPILGYLMGPKTELNISYTGIQLENRAWNTLTLGVLYTFSNK